MKQALNSVQLIIGLGKTGLSCAEYLNEQGIPFKAMDTRDSAPYAKQIEELNSCRLVLCGNPDLHLDAMKQYLEDVEQIIVSPGVALKGTFFDLVQQRELNIIGDIELFAQALNSQDDSAPVIAITGSNGKSTVTELTAELLRAAGKTVLVGGNIGTPVLQLLTQPKPDFYVLELSSFQLESTKSLSLIAGTVLNLSVDHLDRHETFEQYCAIKMEMLEHCQNIVINRDEFKNFSANADREISVSLATDSTTTDYSRQRTADGKLWLANAGKLLIPQSELKIAGVHNVSNAMTSIALCDASGIAATNEMIEKLKQWPGLNHRCQFVGEKQKVRCYNDSKATNVGATIAALEGLSETVEGKLVLIAGGDGKNADFRPLAEVFERYLRALVLIGKDAERLLEEAGRGLQSVIVADMKQAVSSAFSYATPGDAILLSPACASLDMYKSFEHRGDDFTQEVEALV